MSAAILKPEKDARGPPPVGEARYRKANDASVARSALNSYLRIIKVVAELIAGY